MNLTTPLLDVASGSRGALLTILARVERPTSRRQLARDAGISATQANRVIEELTIAGLIKEITGGPFPLVSLNRDHLAAPHVIALAQLRGELIRRLRVTFSGWPDLAGAWLFGSVARGEAGSASDVDILIVTHGPAPVEDHPDLTRLYTDVPMWTGNEAQVLEHTVASWERLRVDGNQLVDEIRRDGIALGDHDRALLARKR